jgi:SdrD B-like domain
MSGSFCDGGGRVEERHPGTRVPRLRPRRRALVVGLAVLCLGATTVLGGWVPAAGAASTVTVSGVVFHDLDNDGVQEPGEPGVAGIMVHRNSGAGTPTTVTDADGRYSLSGLPAGGSGVLAVETGWFRSQCAALSCAAGPGSDNDFPTNNQFIQTPLSKITRSVSGFDVGLLPDWPGSTSAAPSPQGGEVAANPVDVAARLSWASSTCSDGNFVICRPGDTYTVSAQLHNQGTSPLSGLQAVLALAPGDRLATGDPAHDVLLNLPATSPGVTGMAAGPVDDQSRIPMSFTGSLVAGGLVRVTANVIVGGTVGTPGCVRGHPTSSCPVGESQGSPLKLAVTHIDQSGDPDSFGPGCDAATDVRACPTGIHDKQVEPDEVDPVGYNIDADVGSDLTYNLSSRTDLLSSVPADGWHAGQPVTWRMSATNVGPAAGSTGWTLTMLLPKSSTPTVPANNATRKCAKGTSSAGFPLIRCTGKGPLSPGVTSIAVDVAAVIPAATPGGSQLAVVAYVAPATGQVPETRPLGTPPAGPTVPPGDTDTDNDSGSTITLQ